MKIAIDIDDVIVDFIPDFLKFYNIKTGKDVGLDEWKNYFPWENSFFEFDKEEGLKLVEEFFNSDFYEEMKLIDNAKEVINELDKNHKLIILTARKSNLKEKTKEFFDKHFLESKFEILFSDDLYGNLNKKKADICEELGVDIFIEDNKNYANECAKKGILVFLLDKPWNMGSEEHENLIRVNNWNEILEKIKKDNENGR